MKIIISVRGKFFLFDLAREIQKRDSLHMLITTHPYASVKKYRIPRKKTKSLWVHEVFSRITRVIKNFPRFRGAVVFYLKELYDKRASKFIRNDGDLFIGLSSNSLYSLMRAKELGMLTVIERASAHIITQIKLLEEEYQFAGLKYNGHDNRVTERELKEYELADYISVPSTFVYNSFIKNGIPESKLLLNRYGVNLDKFRKIEKSDDVFRVVYCGAVSFQKGVRYLIEAFNCKLLSNIELVIIGPRTNDTSQVLSYIKSKNIKYIGPVKQSELYKYFSNSSVFVMPSIQEGLSLVILQAMACGLPVIATKNSGGMDIIKDGEDGYIIDIRDSSQIRQKIYTLYCDKKLLSTLSVNSYRNARKNHGWDKYGDRAISIYKNILSKQHMIST